MRGLTDGENRRLLLIINEVYALSLKFFDEEYSYDDVKNIVVYIQVKFRFGKLEEWLGSVLAIITVHPDFKVKVPVGNENLIEYRADYVCKVAVEVLWIDSRIQSVFEEDEPLVIFFSSSDDDYKSLVEGLSESRLVYCRYERVINERDKYFEETCNMKPTYKKSERGVTLWKKRELLERELYEPVDFMGFNYDKPPC